MIETTNCRSEFFPSFCERTAGKSPVFDSSSIDKSGLSASATAEETVETEESSFMDALIDTINPLQHLPIISSVYRAVSGDEIDNTAAKIAGDTLYGGVIGGIISIATSAYEHLAGESVEDTIASSFAPSSSSSYEEETSTASSATNSTQINAAGLNLDDLNQPLSDPYTSNAINSYLDAQLTEQQKSAFILSVEG